MNTLKLELNDHQTAVLKRQFLMLEKVLWESKLEPGADVYAWRAFINEVQNVDPDAAQMCPFMRDALALTAYKLRMHQTNGKNPKSLIMFIGDYDPFQRNWKKDRTLFLPVLGRIAYESGQELLPDINLAMITRSTVLHKATPSYTIELSKVAHE